MSGRLRRYNFNGLVRHYFLRRGPHLADLQINLVPQGSAGRKVTPSRERIRERLLPIAIVSGATIQVAEVPPGPPVLQTLVAEIYGPDPARRNEVAATDEVDLHQRADVVDTDWYVEAPQGKASLVVDDEKAVAAGVSAAAVASVVRMAGAGDVAGLVHVEHAREDVPIIVRLPRDNRNLETVRALRVRGDRSVAIGELTRTVRSVEPAASITRTCSR